MYKKFITFSVFGVFLVAISGCAAYRTSSNIGSEARAGVSASQDVIITEGTLPDRTYEKLGPIEVSVKKLTVFHDDPTKEQANEVLTEKARLLGADAVINVVYESGVGFTTWGYIDAEGMAVKFVD